jgi:CubicO group peptidase (beta-lactamase class C family)
MQLVERGKLDLDAPIQTYLTSFPVKQWPVTMRHLLGHLGGIRHYKNASEMFGTQHYWNIADSLKQFENDPLLHEPGTAYAYTTFGYVLAGRAIEVIAGIPYLEYLKKAVFETAKMNATQADDVYRIIPNRARGYQRLDTGEVLNAALLDTSGRIPGGGLSSTASDLVRFAIALDGGKLLRKNTVDAMAQPMTLRNGDSTKYGLGWGVYESEGKKRMIHTGGQSGVSTVLVYALSEHVALAMMFNLESVQLQALTDKILQLVLQR